MENIELIEKVKSAMEEHFENAEYAYFGLRFEDKGRQIGDACERSKHNPDRVDEREFPDFQTPEYDDLDDLGGTSAWEIEENSDKWIMSFMPKKSDGEKNVSVAGAHCYIVAGNETATHDDHDYNEIVINDAVVLNVLF